MTVRVTGHTRIATRSPLCQGGFSIQTQSGYADRVVYVGVNISPRCIVLTGYPYWQTFLRSVISEPLFSQLWSTCFLCSGMIRLSAWGCHNGNVSRDLCFRCSAKCWLYMTYYDSHVWILWSAGLILCDLNVQMLRWSQLVSLQGFMQLCDKASCMTAMTHPCYLTTLSVKGDSCPLIQDWHILLVCSMSILSLLLRAAENMKSIWTYFDCGVHFCLML